MKIDLHDLYNNPTDSTEFVLKAIETTLDYKVFSLPKDENGKVLPIEVCISINGQQYPIDKFVNELVKCIDFTIEDGMEKFMEKRASKLLNVIDNLSTRLKQDICEVATKYYDEEN